MKKNILRWASTLVHHTIPLYAIIIAMGFIIYDHTNSPPPPSHVETSFDQMVYNDAPESKVNSAGTRSSNQDSIRQVVDVAKMTADLNKEQVGFIKETNERMFAFIIVIGGLLSFLGFKGYDTFRDARKAANELGEAINGIEKKILEFESKIENNQKVMDSFSNKYPKDNNAEMAYTQAYTQYQIGTVLLDLSKTNLSLGDIHKKKFESALSILNKLKGLDEVEPNIQRKIYLLRGLILKRQHKLEKALDAVSVIYTKVDKNDAVALYNGACYSALLYTKDKDGVDSSMYLNRSIALLKTAISIEDKVRGMISSEEDFNGIELIARMAKEE